MFVRVGDAVGSNELRYFGVPFKIDQLLQHCQQLLNKKGVCFVLALNIYILGMVFGQILVSPHFHEALPVETHQFCLGLKVAKFSIQFLKPLQSPVNNTQPLLQTNILNLHQSNGRSLQIGLRVVESSAELSLARFLDMVDLDDVAQVAAPVCQFAVGQELGVVVEKKVVLFELEGRVETVDVEGEIAAEVRVLDVSIRREGALLPLL